MGLELTVQLRRRWTRAFASWRAPTSTSRSSTPVAAGPRGRRGSRPGATSSGPTFPNDRVMRWDETDGSVSVFRQPSMNSNGHTVDLQGRLVSCEHRGRCVSRTEFDGSAHGARRSLRRQALQLAQRRRGQERRQHLVHRPELRHRLRLRGRRGAKRDRRVPRLSDRFGDRPCGHRRVGLRPAQRAGVLARRVAALRGRHRPHAPAGRPAPRATIQGVGRTAGRSRAARCSPPVRWACYDGLRVDAHGNLWLSAGDGVHCHASDGSLLGKVLVPEAVANLCFGGPRLNRLFICGTSSLYSVYLMTRAAPRP